MSQESEKLKVDIKAFVSDFVAGVPHADLQGKFMLSAAQVARLVEVLEKRGDITPEDTQRRRAKLGQDNGHDDSEKPDRAGSAVNVDLDTGLVLHCPSCGAAVKRDATHCDYCHSALDFSLTGKTVHCPHCFERIPAASRFCFRCARPVKAVEQPGKALQDRLCPRCQEPMAARMVGDFQVTGCEKCGGLFVRHETFEMMQDTSQRVIETNEFAKPARMEIEKKIAYVRCPVCRTMMNRKNFAQISGVIVDVCGYHGTWFDSGELEKIMDFIARGGLHKARARKEERLKDEEILARLRAEDAMDRGMYGSFVVPEYHLDNVDEGLIEVLSKAFSLFRR